jgi:hypothetical protein
MLKFSREGDSVSRAFFFEEILLGTSRPVPTAPCSFPESGRARWHTPTWTSFDAFRPRGQALIPLTRHVFIG